MELNEIIDISRAYVGALLLAFCYTLIINFNICVPLICKINWTKIQKGTI